MKFDTHWLKWHKSTKRFKMILLYFTGWKRDIPTFPAATHIDACTVTSHCKSIKLVADKGFTSNTDLNGAQIKDSEVVET